MSVDDGHLAASWADQKCCCPGQWWWSTCIMYRHDSGDTSLSKISYFQICMLIHFLVAHLWIVTFLSRQHICCTELEQARQIKSCCKNIRNFVMFVKIKGPSVCCAHCAQRVPKANGNLSFPKGYNRMGSQLVLLVKHEQAALWQDCHQPPAWDRETRLTRPKIRI